MRKVVQHPVCLPVVIGSLALSLRLFYISTFPQTPVVFDAEAYFTTGRSLASGVPLNQYELLVIGLKGPIYQLFLAAIFELFSVDPWPVRYTQAAMGAATCVTLYLLGRQLANTRTGVIAGLIAAAYPTLIVFSGRLINETLAIFILYWGLLALARGISAGSTRLLLVSGCVIALACLTRPTFLPLVPFLGAAVFVGGAVAWRRRLFMAIVYSGTALAALGAWNVLSRSVLGLKPIAGSSGVTFLIAGFLNVGNPAMRGWEVDVALFGALNGWWRQLLVSNPLYIAAAALNLIFQNGLWLADRWWRENFLLPPDAMNWLQRGAFLLGLAGGGLTLPHWRRFAPLIVTVSLFAMAALNLTEPRRFAPFLPGLFIFVAVLIDHAANWLGSTRRLNRLTVIAGTLFLAASALVGFMKVLTPIFFLSLGPPNVVGYLGDAFVALVMWLGGGVVFCLSLPAMGRRRAAVAGFVPPAVFSLFWAAYVAVQAEPRWRAFAVDLGGQAASQTIELPAPLDAGEIQSASWLVDLKAETDPAALAVTVNGEPLRPAEYRWARPFCNPPDATYCPIYEVYAGFESRPLSFWQQWWRIDMDPALLADRQTVSLSLAGDAGRAADIRLGGVFARVEAGRVYGPSLTGLSPNVRTSLYRWLAVDDWRLWETSSVANEQFTSRLAGASSFEMRSLSAVLARGQAHFNIWLLIVYKDGRQIVY